MRSYTPPIEAVPRERDGMWPGIVLADHGIAGIIAACDDIDTQTIAALEVESRLRPPIVLNGTEQYGGVVISRPSMN